MSHSAFEKRAFVGPLWDRIVDWFRPEARKAKKQISAHYESKDPAKWDQFIARAANSDEFIKQLKKSRGEKDKDVLHAISMAGLQKGPTLGQVESESTPGTQYQIRKLPSGDFACTCGDWRYKGSVNPGYECKHIKAHRSGKMKIAHLREKGASFKEKTLAYFHELKRQRDEELKDTRSFVNDGHATSARPFSNVLTQDEEPSSYNPRPAQAIEDPEVILGSGR